MKNAVFPYQQPSIFTEIISLPYSTDTVKKIKQLQFLGVLGFSER
jgi:hypothetical protein